MLLPSSTDPSHHVVSMFAVCCDSLSSRFGCGAAALQKSVREAKTQIECHLTSSHKVTVIKTEPLAAGHEHTGYLKTRVLYMLPSLCEIIQNLLHKLSLC